LPQGNILPIRRKGGLPFRADPESQGVSPPGRGPRPYEDPSRKCYAGQRPLVAGRALTGGFGPRPVLIPVWRNGRGDGPCH